MPDLYILIRWLCKAIVSSLFGDVNIINPENVPLYGSVIFVGNHNNQFIDACVLVASIPRQVKFIVAEKSMKRAVIGELARVAGCISVKRPEDLKFKGIGRIYWNTGDTKIKGINTRFKLDVQIGDKLMTQNKIFSVTKIESEIELILQDPININCEDKVNGVPFKIVPKINQSEVYNLVTHSLKNGDTIGIFPEGGSHDRTNLLPLKPGVAIMTLCALADGIEDVSIIPVGLSYSKLYQLQGCVTIFFGNAIIASQDLCKDYNNNNRETISKLLAKIEEGMRSCMLTSKNHETSRCIELCVSLYTPERMTISKNKIYNNLQLFSEMFWKFGNSKEIENLCYELQCYEKLLEANKIKDDEVWMLKQSTSAATLKFIEQICSLIFCTIFGMTFSLLWLPLVAISVYLAEKHRKTSLKNSLVKIQGGDVVASYKVLVLLVLLPTFNIIYGLLFSLYFYQSWLKRIAFTICSICILPICYYININYSVQIPTLLRQMKIHLKVICGIINVWRDNERELISMRHELQLKVRNIVSKLGHKVSDSFLDQLHRNIPKFVINADTKRLIRGKDEWVPILKRSQLEYREEIL
ncbi:glycerol-3-phosphate 1-O-acyltransferase, putative [Plasmodium berghei]|uniref:Glycerol-3-phosphate 1-O-acyltransferase, putative n=2 Tax=Plasmodium berghei TaxID=5821 RepID=A0A509ARW3_PLABA|nr:glycerol-3-phosphate 1-O-acyltransferase, putative [Plasmodium berghei ANKA]CXJ18735.1 glycerol-3-phosphate 1-O-acyltransferase, putative [Plasmodium berghei]SCM26447.1 glycerol-3-phosphate 1-O-acyltransferase, putative [Plasmodium berghei]SCN28463.1 glycerol-3-phosphate 1-O-acyltransferase, putative [Plasmodium berghei]SCO62653.1 glycerol-3-phosphate 1-O-acyltransferase, putative [Plasmodium berghei]SCO64214.1 glycerol-3-phosphate 1-O-acyltransferase, putative [Plasmodium berghei]|eukprot:XP_034424109.1 glycerol-3-phosphate 1-O-acyltransferase, putative [Plasmodium berghei ANKA]